MTKKKAAGKIVSNDGEITEIGISKDLEVSIYVSQVVGGSVVADIIDPKSKGNGTEDEVEEEEDERPVRAIGRGYDSPFRPHKDFVEAMKKLKKFATDVCEMPGLTDFTISHLKFSGNVTLRQSRVVMTVEKNVKRTGKVIKWKTPQVTMYGDSEYDKAAEMSKAIEVVITEAWAYINGKYSEEEGEQLPLFTRQELQLV